MLKGFNEKTHSSHTIRNIKRYSPTDEDILTIWTAERPQRMEDPTRFQLALDAAWHDVYIKLKDYVHLDYTRRVHEIFTELLAQLQTAGWPGTDYATLHMPDAEAHGSQHREWMRASFPNVVLARALYYVAKDMQVTLGFTPYTLELWSPSFNAEANTRQRSQQMTLFRPSYEVKDFTPQMAQQVFPLESMAALESLISNPTPALPTGGDQQGQGETGQHEESIEF